MWLLAAMVCLTAVGCAVPASARALIPATGAQQAVVQVHEYALIEQSADNPDHASFQKRVPAAVMANRTGWNFQSPAADLKASNQALAPFGFHLALNPSPPFSGFALYKKDALVARDIAHFWPVSVKNGSSSSISQAERDFLLPFVTLSGSRLVASTSGIHPWLGQDTQPVFNGDQIAYADTYDSQASLIAGPNGLYNGSTSSSAAQKTAPDPSNPPSDLHTWGKHWALVTNGQATLDGQDLNKALGYASVFDWQIIAGQPCYFYTRSGITHINFAGQDLPYTYDQIVHGNPGDLSIFNPGSNGHILWFYALRDGLWYYVEIG